MSYALAAYAVVAGGIAAYAAWLARARRQLAAELAAAPERNDG
jgi:CcmD family protein